MDGSGPDHAPVPEPYLMNAQPQQNEAKGRYHSAVLSYQHLSPEHDLMLSDFVGLGVLLTIIGAFIYTQVPAHWQSLGGFLLIVFGWLPLGILALCVFKEPVVLVPVLIVAVALIAPRTSA
jgi:hypothetical protein